MQAIEKLFSCASAHGIDLRQAAGECVKLYGAGSSRRRNLMERLAGTRQVDEKEIKGTVLESAKSVRETVKGKGSRIAKPRFYSHAELGQALAGQRRERGKAPEGGLTGAPYFAAMFSFGLDPQVYDELHRHLRKAMAELAIEDKWPVEVVGFSGEKIHYADELCRLVLVHDWCQPLFTLIPGLYWIYLGVSEEIWRQKLIVPYTSTQLRYERWVGTARAYVDRRLFEEFPRGVDSAVAAA